MREEVVNPDRIVAGIAARQHGVISDRQLVGAGISTSGISRRVAAGRLHRVHRGVYAVGHTALGHGGRCMAGVLACGRLPGAALGGDDVLAYWGAAVSHRSAAGLWGLLPIEDGPIDVSIPYYGGRAKREGISLHRAGSLTPALVTLKRGIPLTTAARTISDLGRVIGPKKVRRAIRQAEVLGLPLGDEAGDRTRSELERAFLWLCRRAGLPEPEVNVRVGPHLVDFLWRDARLVVETDGYRYHRGRTAFEDDRSRDLRLRALGLEVIRLSHRQVSQEPGRVAAVLADALAASD